jgi:hypothetical protein
MGYPLSSTDHDMLWSHSAGRVGVAEIRRARLELGPRGLCRGCAVSGAARGWCCDFAHSAVHSVGCSRSASVSSHVEVYREISTTIRIVPMYPTAAIHARRLPRIGTVCALLSVERGNVLTLNPIWRTAMSTLVVNDIPLAEELRGDAARNIVGGRIKLRDDIPPMKPPESHGSGGWTGEPPDETHVIFGALMPS